MREEIFGHEEGADEIGCCSAIPIYLPNLPTCLPSVNPSSFHGQVCSFLQAWLAAGKSQARPSGDADGSVYLRVT